MQQSKSKVCCFQIKTVLLFTIHSHYCYLFSYSRESASKCECDCRKLKMERSSLKNKVEGLSKEMMRMNKNKSEAGEIEKLKTAIDELKTENYKLKQEQTNLQEKIEVSKSETRSALADLELTRIAHQQSVSFQLSNEGTSDATSEQRIHDLECVISSMTEYLNAKEMQIETLKQVNETLANDIKELIPPSNK